MKRLVLMKKAHLESISNSSDIFNQIPETPGEIREFFTP